MDPLMRRAAISRRHRSLLLLVLVMSAACSSPQRLSEAPRALQEGTLTIRSAERQVRLSIEIARTEEARAAGLMHRENLPADAGMAFLFDQPTNGGFWMKNTLIPLSIAFWDAEGDIVAILDMEPCTQDQCPVHSPGVSYVGAVEVNRGWFELRGVKVGDRAEIRVGQ
jgi:uncharacterized protein